MGFFDGIGGLLGGRSKKKKPFVPTPFEDKFTPQLLAGIEASGQGSQKRLDDTFGIGGTYGTMGGSLQGSLQSRGFGNSSLLDAGRLGIADRRAQAQADLNSQLFAQRLGAQQAGSQLALQQLGINENSRNAYLNRQAQAQQAQNQLLGSLAGAGFSAAFGGFGGFI